MKRTEKLPSNLVPWFLFEEITGIVRCRRCPSTFVGQQATDLALAQHVSSHLMPGKVRPRKAET